ncbi:hypothetical protein V8B97DRAFT_1929415, partial [Scleroderma yunnanense]
MGHFSHSAKTVKRMESFSAAQFASALLSAFSGETLLAIAAGNGTFLVAKIVERTRVEGSNEKSTKCWFRGVLYI